MVDLNHGGGVRIASGAGTAAHFDVAGARRAVAWWSGRAGRVVARVHVADGAGPEAFVLDDGATPRGSAPRTTPHVVLAYDEIRAASPIVRIELVAAAPLERVGLATSPLAPGAAAVAAPGGAPVHLGLRPRSQYEAGDAGRAWCAPASLGILLERLGDRRPTAAIAAAVADRGLGGTGNWSYAAGLAAGRHDAAVLYLADLTHARRFLVHGHALALSFAWRPGELPGAPVGESAGHLAVLCGFDERGDPRFADPARAELDVRYPRDAFERAWLGHGGVAIVVAPRGAADEIERLARERT